MIVRYLLYVVGILVFSTIIFLLLFCYGYVFDKNYDLPVLYLMCIATTTVIVGLASYDNYLMNKAQSALNRKDYQTAFTITKKLAKRDHRQAQYNLSLMCRDGIGTPKNQKEFWHWLEKSATTNPDAQLLYAYAYIQNNPQTIETLEVARRYFEMSAKQKHARQPEALEQLANVEKLLDSLRIK